MPGQTNDQTLLDELLNQKRADLAPEISPQEFMEIFVAQQLLKDHDISYEEIESGIVDGTRDGGIDSIYTFVNGSLVQDDSDYSILTQDISIELYIIQSKTESGFTESALQKLLTHLPELLHLSTDYSTLEGVYNQDVLEQFELFRRCYRDLSPRFPSLAINLVYACKADEPHPNVVRLIDPLKAKLQGLFSNAEVTASLLGAKELLSLARRLPATSLQLALAENPISTGAEAYLCLVPLPKYNAFITDETGRIRADIFDSNVRDYQGHDKQVNAQIQQSLKDRTGEDFWWLNNGVTIVASHAVLSGKTLTIRSPQIVNGLQTSTEVHEYFKTPPEADNRNILVRVLVSQDPAGTDRIIKATNSQTPISPGSLRATDSIQRQIEDYFRHRDLYYDRRKNHYKNAGKPIYKIVTIKQVAQAVTAILLQRPHDARSKPSALLRNDTDYKSIFNQNYPVSLFYSCISLVREVDRCLKKVADLPSRERKYLYLHVAMVVASRITARAQPSAAKLGEIDIGSVQPDLILKSLSDVRAAYVESGGTDRAAKSRPLTDKLKGLLEAERRPPTPTT